MQTQELYNYEIDLKEIFNVLWLDKKFIIQISAIFTIGSLLFSLSLTNYYKSESLLLVRDAEAQGAFSQISSMASLAGVSLPTSGNNKALQAVELIKSRKFVNHLLTFEEILPSIMAAKTYSHSTQQLLFDQKQYDPKTKKWKRKPGNNRQITPTYIEAHREYREMLSIKRDSETGFISISIEHISPVFAKDFLKLIIKESNELLRKNDIEESSQGLVYLTSQLSKTPLVEIKESISSLIESQLETQMAAQINQDYVLIEIEPPFIPEEKSKPSRVIITILGTIFGSVISCFIVLIRHYFFIKATG